MLYIRNDMPKIYGVEVMSVEYGRNLKVFVDKNHPKKSGLFIGVVCFRNITDFLSDFREFFHIISG